MGKPQISCSSPAARLGSKRSSVPGLRIGSLVVGLALGIHSGCVDGGAIAHPRHLVLISIDTLRADYLGAYGHPFVRSPSIDQVAEDGFLFERHITAAPTTLPSHTALMTGTWPHTHGVPMNGFHVEDDNLMLAEVLASEGFETAGFVGAYALGSRFAFDQGFEHWDERSSRKRTTPRDRAARRADEVTDATLDWVRRRASDRSLFLFVHYFDVHVPYTPPGPYARLYRTDDSTVTGTLSTVERAKKELRRGEPTKLQEILRRQYAAGVTWVDSEVGRLLEGLGAEGLLEEAVIVITSDHGEAMGEHWEYWDHGYATFNSTVRVPLIIRLPKGTLGDRPAGRRIESLVSNIDVMPSLLEILGVPIPEVVEGQSFVPALLADRAVATREIAFSEATRPFQAHVRGWRNAGNCRSVQTDRWKIVHLPESDETRLYDLQADPGERTDRSAQEPEQTARLLQQLAAWDAQASRADTHLEIDAEVQRRLQALGYDTGPDSQPDSER